jgi:hypothetical protein
MSNKSNAKVAVTRKTTTTTIYKMDTLNGLRRSSTTEHTEVFEVAEELGFDPMEVRDASDIRCFRRDALAYWDSAWEGRGRK